MRTQQVIWQVDPEEIKGMSEKGMNNRARIHCHLLEVIEKDEFIKYSAEELYQAYKLCALYLLYELGSFFFNYGITKYKNKFTVYFTNKSKVRENFKAN